MQEIKPRDNIDATVTMPGSKGATHRAFIMAALARGTTRLTGFLESTDTLYTRNALGEMGVRMLAVDNGLELEGTGGKFFPNRTLKKIHLGDSGTSFRLLLPVFCLGQGRYSITAASQLKPGRLQELVNALNQLGGDAALTVDTDSPVAFLRAAGLAGGKVSLPGELSSQFVSSLLMTAPCMANGLEIEVRGELISRPYLEVTLEMMKQFGVAVERDGYRFFRVPQGNPYQAANILVEGDAASASYFWAAAAVTGGTVTTRNIQGLTSRQGDMGLLELLEAMGCRVRRELDWVTVQGGPLTGLEADMRALPDMVPTMAVAALFATGETRLYNVPHLRLHEADRLNNLATELRKLGAGVQEVENGLVIRGGGRLAPADLDSHNDHRLAMALAVAGLKVPGLRIDREKCVSKSFPDFWKVWDQL